MDLNSTRTAANTITPEVEQPKPKYGERLLDYYAKKGDSLVEEYKDPTRLAQLAYTKADDRDAMDYDTWSAYHGINDFVAQAPTIAAKRKEAADFEAAKPADRGFLAGTGAALGRGAMNAVGAVGQTMGLADLTPSAIDNDKGYLDRVGEGLVKWSEDKKANTQFMRPTVAEENDANGFAKKAWEGGVESIVTSAAPMAAGFAGAKVGAAVGSTFGPVGTAVGGAIGGLGAYGLARFGMFGAGVYGDTYDKTYAELKQKNPGMGEDEVRRIANKGAWTDSISENVSEAVGDAAAFYTFGGTKILQQPLKATIKDVMKRGIKGIATDVARQMPFEVGSEVANAAVGAQWRQEAGLDGGDMQAAMVDAIGPAVVMSLLMGGGVAGYTEVKARKALNDINSADPNVRAKTANEIAGQINERTKDAELAETWRKEAFARIESAEPIEIDEQIAKFGANKARIDAVDNGEDVAVIPDESEVEAEVEAPLSPAETLLTDGVKTTPEALLMGEDAPVVEQDAPSAILEQEMEASSPEVGSIQDVQEQTVQAVQGPELDVDTQVANAFAERDLAAQDRMLAVEWDAGERLRTARNVIAQVDAKKGRAKKQDLVAKQEAQQEVKRIVAQYPQLETLLADPTRNMVPTTEEARAMAGTLPVAPVAPPQMDKQSAAAIQKIETQIAKIEKTPIEKRGAQRQTKLGNLKMELASLRNAAQPMPLMEGGYGQTAADGGMGGVNGQGISQGTVGQVGAVSEPISSGISQGLQPGIAASDSGQGASTLDEITRHAEGIHDRLVADGVLSQDEADNIRSIEIDDPNYVVSSRQQELIAIAHVRTAQKRTYDRTVGRILKGGGIQPKMVIRDYGQDGAQWLRSRFGLNIINNAGRPLDVWAQVLSEEVPEAGIMGDADRLYSLLREEWPSLKRITDDYRSYADALREDIASARAQMAEREEYRQGKISPSPSPAVAPPSAVDGGAISAPVVEQPLTPMPIVDQNVESVNDKADRPSAETVTAPSQGEASPIVEQSEKGAVEPKLLTRKANLEAKLARLEGTLERNRQNDMPGGFVTGRSGVPASRSRKLDQQMDRTIKQSKEWVDAKQNLDYVNAQIKAQEDAPMRQRVKNGVSKKLDEQFASIEVGDQIDIDGNDLQTVTKKNAKTVVTEGGVKWAAREIGRVIKQQPPTQGPQNEERQAETEALLGGGDGANARMVVAEKEADKGGALYEERPGLFANKGKSVRLGTDRDNNGGRDQGAPQTKPRPRSVALGNVGVQLLPTQIKNSGDAAAALNYLTDNAQEHLVALVLDKNQRPLSIIRHSIGGVSETQLDTGVLVGAVVSTKGANSVWFVHNHPSDSAKLSDRDVEVGYRLENALDGSGVTSNGIIALAPTGYGDAQGSGKEFPASAVGKVSVPVQERVFADFIEDSKGIVLNSPSDVVKNAGAISQGKSGIAFVDIQGRVLGFMPMVGEEMRELRGGKLADVLKQVHSTNAGGIVGILHKQDEVFDFYNIGALGNAIDTQVADFAFLDEGEWRSARADKVLDLPKSTRFYQTGNGKPSPLDIRAAFPWADSITEQDGRTVVTKGKVSFSIEQVETISPNEVAFRASYGRNRNASEQIAGEFLPGKATIRLSQVADKWTVQHEYEHFLEDMGLITPFERGVLDAAIKRDMKAGTLKFSIGEGKDRLSPAEQRAYYVQNELATRDFQRKTTLGRVLQKVADFIDALANLFVRTSRGVVRDVESGAMMGRDAVDGTTEGASQYALPTSTTEAVQKVKELKDDVLRRPEVFGVFNSINTQLHKALKQPAFKRIFDRFHAAAGTQQRAAARAASLAPDILPDHSGNFKQSVRELFTKTREFSNDDLKHVSRVMSMETLAGKDPSPFSGHRLTDEELTQLEAGETFTVGGNEITMNAKQLKLYRQSRAALDQMLTEMATSEAWRIIRGVLTKHQSSAGEFDAKDYWEVFADQPNEAGAAMQDMLNRELEKGQARLTQAEIAAHAMAGVDDMERFREYGKNLTKLNKALDNKEKFSPKQLEDGDLDAIIAKREERIEKLADELGIDANDAEARLKEYKAALKEHTDASQNVENINGAFAQIADVFKKSEQLIKAGYAPLSRFGQYRIDVRDNDGKLIHTSFYDSSTEANRERRSLVKAFDGYEGGAIVGDVQPISQEDWKAFQGANPEALRLFAEKAGAESDEIIQAYYQDAISSRSTLKRLINRQGYAGYSEDLQRIMASFITSGAKRVGANYHAADIHEMVNDEKLPADLRDEARKLQKFIDNPGDAGSAFRAFAANWYMLGSFMSAAWNGTQVFTSTVPELYKNGGTVAGAVGQVLKGYRSLVREYSDAKKDKKDPQRMLPRYNDFSATEKAALKKAMQDGTVDAAEIHHLYAQATKRFIHRLGNGEAAKRAGAFLRLWGMPFAWFEVMNRKASFIAAYRMGEDQGVDDAYAFAKQLVDITQGIYSKQNRMNIARRPVGGAVMTFMQYKIMTLEQITRNAKEGGQARKAAALQLAIIAAIGGWKALPGVEDITDLYDTIMQTVFGKATLSKKAMREAVEKGSVEAAGLVLEKESAEAVGKFFADMMNVGIVTAALPVDVSGRASMGGLIPGLKLLKPSTQYRDSIVFDMAGVPGSMIDSLIDASGMVLQGDMGRAAMRLAPNAVGAAVKGIDILATGEIRNTRGKKVTDGTPVDGALQMVGAQPKEKSRINTRLRENQELKFLTQSTEKSIVSEWADAYEKKGVVAQREALVAVRKRIADWNSANPDWPIVVKQTQVMNELKNRKKTTVQLASKSAPKELRRSMAVE